MKNKTIEILAEGDHCLPIGTKVKTLHSDGERKSCDLQIELNEYKIDSENKNSCGFIVQVDFSDLPPFYPTKGMEVPEEGIEFADGRCTLFDAGQNGITYYGESSGETYFEKFNSKEMNTRPWKLKRALPKTITVCADCFKETCECKHEMTTLDVMYFWEVVKSKGSILLSHIEDVENYDLSFDFRVDSNVSEWRWNELVHVNGATKLKHDEWKEFTFENCLINVTPEN